ncbi:MAG: DUF2339 domain-containing protein, partial [Candidatus Parcubacteria bacterium]|nr:DUF2339 domain-containing protein [Candidatus Parcubacteria bacterium]
MVVGGFLTPIFIATGNNNQIALFVYVLFLGAAILAVAFLKNWKELTLLGALGTFAVFWRWYFLWYSADQLWMTLIFLTIFFVVYSTASLVYNLVKKESVVGWEQSFIVIVSLGYFIFGKVLLDDRYSDEGTSLLALGIAMYYIILSFTAKVLSPKDSALFSFLSVLSASFLAMAIYWQFDKSIITLGLTIEALLLIYIGLSSKQKLIEGLGLALGILAILKLLLSDVFAYLDNYQVILNRTFVLFAVVAVACYAAGYLYKN